MLAGMGFCAATLIALMLMPLVSHRARRQVERRFERADSRDEREAAAARDGMRAIAAVEQRRAEQRIEQATLVQAEAQAELGRRAARIIELEQLGEAERTRLTAEFAQSRDASIAAQARIADIELTLVDAQNRAKLAEEGRQDAAAKRDEADALANERQLAVTRLTTRIILLETRIADRDGVLERERQETNRARTALSDVTRDRDLARNELLLATTQRTMVEADLKDTNRRSEDLRARFQARASDLANLERRLVEERAEKKAAEAALAELRTRFQALEARLIETGGTASNPLGEAELTDLRESVAALSDRALAVLTPTPPPPKPRARRPKKAAQPSQAPNS